MKAMVWFSILDGCGDGGGGGLSTKPAMVTGINGGAAHESNEVRIRLLKGSIVPETLVCDAVASLKVRVWMLLSIT